MRKPTGISFSLQKVFYGQDVHGNRTRYIEPIAYFTDLHTALKEKSKHSMSFVFPFQCRFYPERRKEQSIIRVNYH